MRKKGVGGGRARCVSIRFIRITIFIRLVKVLRVIPVIRVIRVIRVKWVCCDSLDNVTLTFR
jgi:hypothetical protein